MDVVQAAAQLIDEKLERVRAYLKDEYLLPAVRAGRIDEDSQFAYRLIQSRQRAILRHVLTRTRPENDPARRKAEIELSLPKQDIGELFRWMYSNHSIGRLDCPGCDSDSVIDKPTGLPVKVYLARLCPICGQGLQHCLVVDSAAEAVQAVRSFWEGVGLSVGAEEPTGGPESDVGGVLFACEACHGYQLEAKS